MFRPRTNIGRQEALIHEEIDFWRRLIAEIEGDGREPVHPRYREALAAAEEKLHWFQMLQNGTAVCTTGEVGRKRWPRRNVPGTSET